MTQKDIKQWVKDGGGNVTVPLSCTLAQGGHKEISIKNGKR